jgi:hypothetical protein
MPTETPRRTREDNIKTDFKGTWLDCVDWINLAQDSDKWQAVVGTVMNRRVT